MSLHGKMFLFEDKNISTHLQICYYNFLPLHPILWSLTHILYKFLHVSIFQKNLMIVKRITIFFSILTYNLQNLRLL